MVTPPKKKTTGKTSKKPNTLVQQKISKKYIRILFMGELRKWGTMLLFTMRQKMF